MDRSPFAPFTATATLTGPGSSEGAVQEISNSADVPVRGRRWVAHCTCWSIPSPQLPERITTPEPAVAELTARLPGWPQPSPDRAVSWNPTREALASLNFTSKDTVSPGV